MYDTMGGLGGGQGTTKTAGTVGGGGGGPQDCGGSPRNGADGGDGKIILRWVY